MNGQRIRVIVVDDSPVLRELLVQILSEDPEITVAGTAGDGAAAVALARLEKPDVITMDVNMPVMDGIEATRRIMAERPVPVVIITSQWDPANRGMCLRALGAGAVEVIEKPRGIGHPGFKAEAGKIVAVIKAAALARAGAMKAILAPPGSLSLPPRGKVRPPPSTSDLRVVAVGVSTGGPAVLKIILRPLPASYPVPIVIVQHIAAGFAESLAAWLDKEVELRVEVPGQECVIRPGCAYIAPGGRFLRLDSGGRVSLSEPGEGYRGPCPSVAALFSSVGRNYGPRAAGVLLTGMGKDGAAELKAMRERGALTIAQDRESSVVHGMPGGAIRIGAAQYVLSPGEIAEMLVEMGRSGSLSPR